MKKKRLVNTLLLFTLIFSFLVVTTGCQESNENGTQDTDQEDNLAEDVQQEADLVIIGGGAGGLMASIDAANEGLDVTVLEKMPFVGEIP